MLLLVIFFGWAGALSPTNRLADLPAYASSRREVIGMALLLIGLPPYFFAAAIVVRRHSLDLLESLRPAIPRSADLEEARASILSGWGRAWAPGALLGVIMGVLNTSLPEGFETPAAQRIHLAIALGQGLLWLCIGIFFALRLDAARIFRRLSAFVEVDLFALERLYPIARSGLADVMIVAGALAFTPLQSLDAGFRLGNYQFGWGVAVVASTILFFWPLLPIHRRLRAEKAEQLAALDQMIAERPNAPSAESRERLELLLLHRDRIRDAGTWLISTNLVSRVFLYIVIPPMAWVGAAIVERFVDQFLAG